MLKFIVIGLVVCAIVFWRKNRRFFALTKKLRHDIKSYPILGLSHLFFGGNEDQMKAFQTIGNETTKQGGIIADWFGPKVYVSITDPFLAEFVLKNCLEKDDMTRFSRLATGNGTIFAPVAIWRKRRRIVSPGFTIKNLMTLVGTFAKHSNILADKLREKAGAGSVRLWSYLETYSIDSVSETTLGAELNSQRDDNHPFRKGFAEGVNLISNRTCQPWLHSDLVYKRLHYHTRLNRALEFGKKFINEIIDAKRESVRQEKENPSSTNQSTFRTLLEIMLREFQGKQVLTNEELQDEMMTFMVAGTDTGGVAIGFTLLMLARHPDVQEKVYKELHDVFGNSERPAEAEDMSKLTYLELVIKETLRLYPPGVVSLRKVEEDVELPSGIVLPAGCGVAVNMWATHRHPEYWGVDAEQFRPERFLIPLRHPTQYMAFSAGPRHCIGYQFAMLSLKTALSTVLRRYKVTPALAPDGSLPKLRLKFDFLLKDVDNFTLCLEHRDAENNTDI